jgi:uncharacterized OsmC-like protein
MNAEELRALQAPLKSRYREDPAGARITLSAAGDLSKDNVTCTVGTFAGPVVAGLHEAAGGDGRAACAGAMLLEALAACAGVTLKAVATALAIPLRGGTIRVEGDLDMRGTLGVNRDVPIGLDAIRLRFDLDADATEEQLQKLSALTERYCVVYQTLLKPPTIAVEVASR